jgi:MtfA peptidase
MSDTIHLSNPGKPQDLPALADSMRLLPGKAVLSHTDKDTSVQASMEPVVFFILLGAVIFLLLLKLSRVFKSPIKSAKTEIVVDEAEAKNIYIYDGEQLAITEEDIRTILLKRYPYYIPLSPELKQAFEKRVKRFIATKSFIIPANETYREVPVLLAAAAVQLTFGLQQFELPWFQYIRIHQEEYFADDPDALRVLAGHVESNIITVAWNHFLKGIEDNYDGVNVGLHEMAHALYYQQVIINKNKKNVFIKELSEVMEESEDIYALKHKHKILYSDNAYKNLQEFWAESIELFFERPEAMKICYPELFENLKELLNQDPLNKTNPLLS